MKGCLAGLVLGNSKKKIKVVAYADDITVVDTHPEELNSIRQDIDKYERASGALLNPGKSKALAIGNWANPVPQLGIAFHSTVKILGISFAATTELSGKNSWDTIVNTVRAQAKRTYARNLCLAQRRVYVNTFLLAKIWYIAEVLQPRPRIIQQLTTICNWYIWQGAIFRVPTSTIYQQKTKGGWGLLNIETKCRTLLLYLMWMLSRKGGTVKAEWMQRWRLMDAEANPSYWIPDEFQYLRSYATDMPYIAPPPPPKAGIDDRL
jgi:hypothetical protein